jgi:hypothetical protein
MVESGGASLGRDRAEKEQAAKSQGRMQTAIR